MKTSIKINLKIIVIKSSFDFFIQFFIRGCLLYSEDTFLSWPFCIHNIFHKTNLGISNPGFHKKQINQTIQERTDRRTFKF